MTTYQLCQHCDHFAAMGGEVGHLEDGNQEFDHDPTPTGKAHTLAWWRKHRPDLFHVHPDGAIGPNGSRRGKM